MGVGARNLKPFGTVSLSNCLEGHFELFLIFDSGGGPEPRIAGVADIVITPFSEQLSGSNLAGRWRHTLGRYCRRRWRFSIPLAVQSPESPELAILL